MIRALICDIYGTLLEVRPPPPRAESSWNFLWRTFVHASPPPTLKEFSLAVEPLIAHHHALGRARGLVQPEVDWPALAGQAFPPLQQLSPDEQTRFFETHAFLSRTTRLAPGAADCLRAARTAGLLLGIASNAQASTRLELSHALAAADLNLNMFDHSLSFYSYEHGLAKPDPGVCDWFAPRLAARGLSPEEILMVGDREDNDITPAAAAGWRTWLISHAPSSSSSPYSWFSLQQWLRDNVIARPPFLCEHSTPPASHPASHGP
jgi:FMN phosphatase YigB (HAD superfamily)